MGQLTNITVQNQSYPWGTAENLTYNYPSGMNNGKVSSMYNAVSGETVTYTYDTLNRIATASGCDQLSGCTQQTFAWTQQYTFDPFGNLTGKTGSGPSLSIVEFCDGNHTVHEIIAALQKLYSKAEPQKVEQDILGYLARLHEERALDFE